MSKFRINGGLFKGHPITVPKNNDTTRPTQEKIRQMLFNIIQWRVEGAHFVDLFAGTGSLGLEALSRGAEHAYFVDQNYQATKAIEHTLQNLDVTKAATILKQDALRSLSMIPLESIDIFTIDPPYPLYEKLDKDKRTLIDHLLMVLDQTKLKQECVVFVEGVKEKPLEVDHLETLECKSVRNAGRTVLYEFVIKKKGPQSLESPSR